MLIRTNIKQFQSFPVKIANKRYKFRRSVFWFQDNFLRSNFDVYNNLNKISCPLFRGELICNIVLRIDRRSNSLKYVIFASLSEIGQVNRKIVEKKITSNSSLWRIFYLNITICCVSFSLDLLKENSGLLFFRWLVVQNPFFDAIPFVHFSLVRISRKTGLNFCLLHKS